MDMKRAFITAATSSIGRVMARQLGREGYELVLHYHSNEQLAHQLAKETNATVVQADLMDGTAVDGLLTTLAGMGKFDVLINNAGKAYVLDDRDRQAWESTLRIGAVVPALLMASAAVIVNQGGVIINMSSIYGNERFGNRDMAAFNASKAALNSLTRTFAKKLAPGIRVNAIAPGSVASSWNEHYSAAELQRIENQLLTRTLIDPQQIADLVSHIIRNTALDGEVIYLDAGQTLQTIE
jgi:NAD(P)-dependent dehydrogenase (short-subunit alcohol dehydrogenase family)